VSEPESSAGGLASLTPRRGWGLALYPEAAEAGGSFRSSLPSRGSGYVQGPAENPERSAAEAARRARGKVRRYVTANRLNRLGTLTYAGDGCHDLDVLVRDVGVFWRRLRRSLGGKPLPYLWVPEWHKSGHGLHVHFAVGQFIARSKIDAAWGHGFVHIKLLGDLPVGSGTLGEARAAAGYLSKYIGKAFADERIPGRNRYNPAEGFQPSMTPVWASNRDAAIRKASHIMGREPRHVWLSATERQWLGPPALWLQWT
jgi:hypothetical protein